MTFKGATYSSMLDLECLIIVWEANLRALEIEFKYYSVAKEIRNLQETQVKINIYKKALEELIKEKEDLLNKFSALFTEMNDTCSKVFEYKFIKGLDNKQIMEALSIEKTTLYYYYDKINKLLEETTYGKQIKEALSE